MLNWRLVRMSIEQIQQFFQLFLYLVNSCGFINLKKHYIFQHMALPKEMDFLGMQDFGFAQILLIFPNLITFAQISPQFLPKFRLYFTQIWPKSNQFCPKNFC